MPTRGYKKGTPEHEKYIGFYHNSDGTEEPVTKQIIAKVNSNIDGEFTKRMERKGAAANYAYEHNVNEYLNKYQFLENDSWYSNNFFYVTDLPGFENQKVAFQLRISDHILRADPWMKNRSGSKKCQFALNIMINPSTNNKNITDEYDGTDGLVILNATYSPNEWVDNLVDQVVANQKPVISYNDLVKNFNGNIEMISKEGDIDDVNFNDRETIVNDKPEIPRIKLSYFNDEFTGRNIRLSDVVDGVKYYIFPPEKVTINGKNYIQVQIDKNYYVFDGNTVRQKFDDNTLSEPLDLINEHKKNIITLNEEQLKKVVIESVKKILYN